MYRKMRIRVDKKGGKRSQAALEFLTTYAWAFLVILIMIGALAYFGILQPTKLLPDRCNFGTEIGCVDFAITYGSGADGTVGLRLKNSVGEPIILQTMNITSDSATAFDCTLTAPGTPYTWGTDDVQDFSFTTCNNAVAGFVQGEKARFEVTIEYYSVRSSATYAKQVLGEVFATVT